MSWALMPYPTLTQELFQQLGYVSDTPVINYFDAGVNELSIEELSNSSISIVGKISDPKCDWNPGNYDLHYERVCRFTSAYYLFGEGGIAPEDAVIGVAVFWSAKNSSVRGAKPVGELRNTSTVVEIKQTLDFPKNTLKGSVVIQTVLYLKEPGENNPSNKYFAQQSGTILGGLEQVELLVDGNGSLFPIVVVEQPKAPLWEVYYNETADVFQDLFENDNVEIRLNKAHPYFELLDIDSELSKTPLLVEALSSAMTVIIQSVKDNTEDSEWSMILSGEEGEPGSIAQAIHYFVNTLGWDVSSAPAMSKSIKVFFEKEGS